MSLYYSAMHGTFILSDKAKRLVQRARPSGDMYRDELAQYLSQLEIKAASEDALRQLRAEKSEHVSRFEAEHGVTVMATTPAWPLFGHYRFEVPRLPPRKAVCGDIEPHVYRVVRTPGEFRYFAAICRCGARVAVKLD